MSNCKNLLIQLLLLEHVGQSQTPPLFKEKKKKLGSYFEFCWSQLSFWNDSNSSFQDQLEGNPPSARLRSVSAVPQKVSSHLCSSLFLPFECELISSVSHDGFVLFAACLPWWLKVFSVAPPPGLEPPGSSSRTSCEKLIQWDCFWMQFYSFII